jgi:hypothetical protein
MVFGETEIDASDWIECIIPRQSHPVLERHIHEHKSCLSSRLVQELPRMLHVFDNIAEDREVEPAVRVGDRISVEDSAGRQTRNRVYR